MHNLTTEDINFIKSTFDLFIIQLKEDAEFENNDAFFSSIKKYEIQCKLILKKLQ